LFFCSCLSLFFPVKTLFAGIAYRTVGYFFSWTSLLQVSFFSLPSFFSFFSEGLSFFPFEPSMAGDPYCSFAPVSCFPRCYRLTLGLPQPKCRKATNSGRLPFFHPAFFFSTGARKKIELFKCLFSNLQRSFQKSAVSSNSVAFIHLTISFSCCSSLTAFFLCSGLPPVVFFQSQDFHLCGSTAPYSPTLPFLFFPLWALFFFYR